jgi:hypothetical protein
MKKIKEFLKLFTLSGFKDGNKSYIIGFISFYFSIASIVFSIYTYYFPYKISKSAIVANLNNLEANNQWGKLNQEVNKLENDNDNKDIYYLYKGRIAARLTQVPKINPDFYFSRVDLESPYYREVLHSRTTNYLLNYSKDERTKKFKNLANQMEKDEMNYDYYYFFVRLLSLDNYNYHDVLQLYKEYSNLYSEYSIEKLGFDISTTKVGVINFDNKKSSQVQSLYLIFLTDLLYLAQHENIVPLPRELVLVKQHLIERNYFVVSQVKILLNFTQSPSSFEELQSILHKILTQ